VQHRQSRGLYFDSRPNIIVTNAKLQGLPLLASCATKTVIPGNQTLSFGPLLLCAVAAIESQKDYEITPFAGNRFWGNIYLSQQGNRNADYLKIKGSEDYGVMAGPPFAFFHTHTTNSAQTASKTTVALFSFGQT